MSFKNLSDKVHLFREMPKGRKSPKSEMGEQIDAYQWFIANHRDLEQALFYVPNETQGATKGGKITGGGLAHQKRMNEAGRSAGVSDLVFLHQTKTHPYAVFELKAKFHGAPSPEEKDFLNYHAERGAFACICWGCDSFIEAMNFYLQN